jgi:REP element-mobilizing transposase RayT
MRPKIGEGSDAANPKISLAFQERIYLLSDFFIVVRLLRRREKFTEPDFALLARAFIRARALHPFHLTAWVFLPDHWHCICAPVYPVTISLAMKSVKQSSMSAVNQRRGTAVASSGLRAP